eukprot:4759946-Pleurochrysis_carterae.AAC.2
MLEQRSIAAGASVKHGIASEPRAARVGRELVPQEAEPTLFTISARQKRAANQTGAQHKSGCAYLLLAPGAKLPRYGSQHVETGDAGAEYVDRRPCATSSDAVSGDASRLPGRAHCSTLAREERALCGRELCASQNIFHHAMSCLRRPAGRADRGGSQQAAFSMEVPSMQPLKSFLAVCKAYPQSRYTVNEQGAGEDR